MGWARALAVFPVLGLGWATVYAVDLGTEATVTFDAAQELAEGAAGVRPQPSTESVARMRAELDESKARVPADPTVHELLGLLLARNRQEYPGQAGVHFLKSLELRPTSPNAWANVAAARYREGDTGTGFESALVRAAQLGPHEPEVQGVVATYGLAVFNEITPATRNAVEAMVTAGMKRKPLEMLQIADRRGRLDVACRHLAGPPRQTDSKVTQLCPSLEPTP